MEGAREWASGLGERGTEGKMTRSKSHLVKWISHLSEDAAEAALPWTGLAPPKRGHGAVGHAEGVRWLMVTVSPCRSAADAQPAVRAERGLPTAQPTGWDTDL